MTMIDRSDAFVSTKHLPQAAAPSDTCYLTVADDDDTTWTVIGGIVDLFFLGDLVINFFTAYHDEEFNFIDDRRVTSIASYF